MDDAATAADFVGALVSVGMIGLVSVALLACAVAASTSSFITRPEGPEPATCARSTPFSAATFLATLDARTLSVSALFALALAAVVAVVAVGRVALVSIEATIAPTLIASPLRVAILSLHCACGPRLSFTTTPCTS